MNFNLNAKSSNTKYLILLFVVFSLFSFQCKKKEKEEKSDSGVMIEGKEFFMYRSLANGVKIHREPNLGSEVFHTIDKGQKIIDKKEKTEEEIELEVSGKMVKAPWFKVALGDGRVGWAFGGSLEVVRELTQPPPQTDTLQSYKDFTNTLQMNCGDLKKAKDRLLEDFKDKKPEEADKAIAIYYALHNTFLQKKSQSFLGSQEARDFGALVEVSDPSGLSPKLQKKLKEYNGCGLTVIPDMDQGILVLEPDFFYENFSGIAGGSMKSFLKEIQAEANQPLYASAPITVAQRLDFWSNFQEDYPDFVLDTVVHKKIQDYRTAMKTGVENNPVFDYNPPYKMTEDWKKAYEWYLSQGRNKHNKDRIQKEYDLIKKNDFQKTDG